MSIHSNRKSRSFILIAFVCLLTVKPAVAEHITEITWTIDTKKLSGGSMKPFLFPLPVSSYGQKVTFMVGNAIKTEVIDIPQGNTLIYIYPSQPVVGVRVTITSDYTGLPKISQYGSAQENVPIPPQILQYLKVTYGLDHTTPAVAAVAATLKGKSNLESVKNVLRYVSQQIKYDYTYWRTTDDILAHKVTQCEGQSAVAVALLRNLGIPARMVFLVRPNKSTVIGGHTITQFYLKGIGWFMGDPGANDHVFYCTPIVYGEEPIPYYYCRQGMGALLKLNESLQHDYPPMWQYWLVICPGPFHGRVDSRLNVTLGLGLSGLRCLTIEVTEDSEEVLEFSFNAFLQLKGI